MADLTAVEASSVFDRHFWLRTLLPGMALGQAVRAGRVCLASCWALSFGSWRALGSSAFLKRELASDEGVQLFLWRAALGQGCCLCVDSKFGVVSSCAFFAAFQQVVLAGRRVVPLKPLNSVADPAPQVVGLIVEPSEFLENVVV